jgi:pimeloyl-ACP methyl ester carboxylesterase
MRNRHARRLALYEVAAHGDRFTPAQTVAAIRDMVECVAAADLLVTSESVAPLDPPPCPITLAWAARDRIFPPQVNGAVARQRIPAARYLELPDVGHIPMIDDPRLCADTIRTTVNGASKG